MEIIPLASWYPSMSTKWTTSGLRRPVARSQREAWVHHHSAGGSASNPGAYARQVADMHYNEWRVPGGYNFFIGTDGVVREMCGYDYEGVHAGSGYWNEHGLALCYQGDYRTRPPSQKMLDAASELIGTFPLPQTYHRAVRPTFTSCPGDAVIRLIPLPVGDDMPSPKDWTAEDWAAFNKNVRETVLLAPVGRSNPNTGKPPPWSIGSYLQGTYLWLKGKTPDQIADEIQDRLGE